LGEQHGTKNNYSIALKYLGFLTKKARVDYVLIENSYFTEILLNKYFKTGNEEFLNESIKNYSGTWYANNELKEYLKSVYKLYQSLPQERKFRFVSIDIEQTYTASENYIHSFLTEQKLEKEFLEKIDFDKSKDNHSRMKYYSIMQNFFSENNIVNDTISYMTRNMQNTLTAYINGEDWDEVRDSLMFQNFKIRDETFDFKDKISFAFWGTEHCYKSSNKNGVKWISSLINNNLTEIKQNSTVIIYDKSEFLRHKSKFPKLSRFLFKKIDQNYISHTFQNEPFNKLRDKKHLRKNKLSDITMWKVKGLNPKWNFITKKTKNKESIDYIDNVILLTGSTHCMPYYGE